MTTSEANETIIAELKKQYGNFEETGWKNYLKFWLGAVKNNRESAGYTLQTLGEKALKDFKKCMSSGELESNPIIRNAVYQMERN